MNSRALAMRMTSHWQRIAEEALVDRRPLRLDEAQWQAFQKALDRPVVKKPRLSRLLSEKSLID